MRPKIENEESAIMEESGWVFDPSRMGPILAPLWASIMELLGDGRWHGLADVRAELVAAGANRGTVENLLKSGRRAKYIAWTGQYSRKTRRDTRMIRIAE